VSVLIRTGIFYPQLISNSSIFQQLFLLIGVGFSALKFAIECLQVELGVLERGGIIPVGAQPADEFKSCLGEALERY